MGPETIFAGGTFKNVGGDASYRLVRLKDDGAILQAFDPGFDSDVEAIARQTDGSITVGGDFVTVNGIARTRLARLSASGVLDEARS